MTASFDAKNWKVCCCWVTQAVYLIGVIEIICHILAIVYWGIFIAHAGATGDQIVAILVAALVIAVSIAAMISVAKSIPNLMIPTIIVLILSITVWLVFFVVYTKAAAGVNDESGSTFVPLLLFKEETGGNSASALAILIIGCVGSVVLAFVSVAFLALIIRAFLYLLAKRKSQTEGNNDTKFSVGGAPLSKDA